MADDTQDGEAKSADVLNGVEGTAFFRAIEEITKVADHPRLLIIITGGFLEL